MADAAGMARRRLMVLALWVLCAVAAVASPTKRPVKGHAVKARSDPSGSNAGCEEARGAKSKKPAAKLHRQRPYSKATPRTKTRQRKSKADAMEFDPPTVQRARMKAVDPGAVPAVGRVSQASLPAMPPTNTEVCGTPCGVCGTGGVGTDGYGFSGARAARGVQSGWR